jgi:transposase InsO family protein
LGRFHVVGKRILRDGVQRSRRAGWQHVHIAIDDHSRLAYTEVLAGQDKQAGAAFLRRAVAWYAQQGITIERVVSDNAKAYHSQRWHQTCQQLGIRYAYPSSHHRTRALSGWTRWYNRHRPHGSLGGRPPISRVSHLRGQYT